MKFDKDLMNIIITCVIYILINIIWMLLELFFYGQIQHRVVDDVISSLFIPLIYVFLNTINKQ